MIPKTLKFRRDNARLKIQKYMRGYYAFQKVKFELGQKRLASCFSYFNKMRAKLYVEKAIVIQRWIRSYWLIQSTQPKIEKRKSSIKKIHNKTRVKNVSFLIIPSS